MTRRQDTWTRRVDGKPETAADKRFFDLRESGYTGPIDQDGRKVTGGRGRGDPGRHAPQVQVATRFTGMPRGGRTAKHDRPGASFPAKEGIFIMTRNDNDAARRAADIPDLRELADRIDVVLAHSWIDRGGFLRDAMQGLKRAAHALPAGQSRARLPALAEGIGVELADPRAELDGVPAGHPRCPRPAGGIDRGGPACRGGPGRVGGGPAGPGRFPGRAPGRAGPARLPRPGHHRVPRGRHRRRTPRRGRPGGRGTRRPGRRIPRRALPGIAELRPGHVRRGGDPLRRPGADDSAA